MKGIIQQITQQLIGRLPDNDQYYRLDELRSWGFPSFIVKRIKIELERNLAESMIPPKTDWANIQSDTVQFAWQKFVDAIRAEARLPASYAKTVIETAVADVIEMLVQPRKNIPDVIFGRDKKLTYDQIADRAKAVVVFRHFATLVPRFMEKKELKKLSKKRCSEIIAEADEKMTDQYSPLNWAQMLEPLFNLADGEIDTNLLRLFFEDKNMPRVARKFDLIDDAVTRAEFIEILSSPELMDFEGYEDDQSSLFDEQQNSAPQEEQKSEGSPGEKTTDSKTESETETETEKEVDAAPTDEENGMDDPFPDKDEISKLLFPDEQVENRAEKQKSEEGNKDDSSGNEDLKSQSEDAQDNLLNEKFVKKDQEEDRKEKPKRDLANTAKGHEKDLESDNGSVRKNKFEEGKDDKSDEQASTSLGDNDDKETPMWMRFMSEEEIEEYKKQELGESEIEEADADKDGFIDDPIIDLTNEGPSDDEIEELMERLQDDRDLFVEEIFRGSDRAYDEAVEEIAAYDSWRSASKFIQKDIFKRNLVDMYSEEAVDFTDRLQSYFWEKQKSK